jgi:hypothetical protein
VRARRYALSAPGSAHVRREAIAGENGPAGRRNRGTERKWWRARRGRAPWPAPIGRTGGRHLPKRRASPRLVRSDARVGTTAATWMNADISGVTRCRTADNSIGSVSRGLACTSFAVAWGPGTASVRSSLGRHRRRGCHRCRCPHRLRSRCNRPCNPIALASFPIRCRTMRLPHREKSTSLRG